ncbi:MAG: hypothetical protein P0S95_02845 [Rhabdochlamydiaceae bacterium]|nr:hypothetical protein [Candidatus Amphrikana amoebophyrae]
MASKCDPCASKFGLAPNNLRSAEKTEMEESPKAAKVAQAACAAAGADAAGSSRRGGFSLNIRGAEPAPRGGALSLNIQGAGDARGAGLNLSVGRTVSPEERILKLYGKRPEELTVKEKGRLRATGHPDIDLTHTTQFEDLSCNSSPEPFMVAAEAGCIMAESGEGEGCRPIATTSGTTGSYFIKDVAGNKVAVFKPCDEQIGTKHDPNIHFGSHKQSRANQATAGITPGHEPIFEVIASKWAPFFPGLSIPKTELVKIASNSFNGKGCAIACSANDLTKVGSLQEFKPGINGEHFSAEEIEPLADPAQFAMMMAFDLATYSSDRNRGNVLIDEKKNIHLIDNSAMCARGFQTPMKAFWYYSESAKRPFPKEAQKAISELNPEDMIAKAREEFAKAGQVFPEEHGDTLRMSIHILQTGVEHGLTPQELVTLFVDPQGTAAHLLKTPQATNEVLQLSVGIMKQSAASISEQVKTNLEIRGSESDDQILEVIEHHLRDGSKRYLFIPFILNTAFKSEAPLDELPAKMEVSAAKWTKGQMKHIEKAVRAKLAREGKK